MNQVELEELLFIASEIQDIKSELDDVALYANGGGMPYDATEDQRARRVAFARSVAKKMEDRLNGCVQIIQRRTVECQESMRDTLGAWHRKG